MVEFNISKLSEKLEVIAKKIDNNYNKNGKIDGTEVSLFYQETQNLNLTSQECNSIFGDYKQKNCPQENTYVALANLESPQQDTKTATPKPEVDNIKTSNTYDYKKDPKYKETFNFVKSEAKSHKNNLSDEELDKITGMILEKCKKYNISDFAHVIAQMLGTESGGYVFEDKVMKNPGKQFKGVMQVNLETICCIYGTCEPNKIPIGGIDKEGKAKTISSRKDKKIYEYDNTHHFNQDLERINALKLKYPTPKDLYLAIQKDVELGLEVGIIAFKAKISYCKGNIKEAIASYCGDQYKCNTRGLPPQINIKQRA